MLMTSRLDMNSSLLVDVVLPLEGVQERVVREILVPRDLRPSVLSGWGSGVLNILQCLGQFMQRIFFPKMPVVSPLWHTVLGSWGPSLSSLRLLQGRHSQTDS